MQIECIPEYALTAADDQSIADLLLRGFAEDFGGRSYHQQRHHMRIIARNGGAMIGHMAICYRDVCLGENLTTICGLAEVVTAPETRGKGVATQLLKAAITFAESTQAKFFVLFGDRPIYAGHGFITVGNVITYTSLDYAKTGQVITRETQALMVLPLTDQPWDEAAPLDLLGWNF
ncbi:GNAT family N-acetyltransferase [Octadecabacter ascidiaceicola]|uniref:N-acetyltransferase domain-containing protein n=1 Tax=Octadecabacter ascidiaceicola TaxID=1655543 RepID=A0A238KCJ3_9RHOB|nr:GNAT family N-acetyltransferase [Octadecabacter ascidiaceicola]SMX40247.1 hypothetical protein OCA8868_02330 [Octadecabacter ascidiaceicola]